MGNILIYDERLWGSPPWGEAQATCLVNEKHSMSSIVSWLSTKCAKYKGKETVYIMAHGNKGWIQLGKDGLNADNAHLWGSLEWKLNHIIILSCSVAGDSGGYWFCSRLAWYTSSFVTAAESRQNYIALPWGILPTTFGGWEGKVHTWGPNGEWLASSGQESYEPEYGSF